MEFSLIRVQPHRYSIYIYMYVFEFINLCKKCKNKFFEGSLKVLFLTYKINNDIIIFKIFYYKYD